MYNFRVLSQRDWMAELCEDRTLCISHALQINKVIQRKISSNCLLTSISLLNEQNVIFWHFWPLVLPSEPWPRFKFWLFNNLRTKKVAGCEGNNDPCGGCWFFVSCPAWRDSHTGHVTQSWRVWWLTTRDWSNSLEGNTTAANYRGVASGFSHVHVSCVHRLLWYLFW